MRVLVVRPASQASATLRALQARGHEGLSAPILSVRVLAGAAPSGMPDAILVTSANAVAALATQVSRFGALPVYAVGDATAMALTDAGFGAVRSASGAACDLAALIGRDMPPGATLLQVAGRDRRQEPAQSLGRAGFAIETWEAYAAEAAAYLPDPIATALRAQTIDAALHFSRRSAAILADLAAASGLSDPLGALLHVCLSPQVALGLESLPSPRVLIAAQATERALLAALDQGSQDGADEPGSRIGSCGC